MGQTPLSRALAGTGSRPDALAAFRLARATFVAGQRVEMQEVANELGVSRTTVFRWVGSRDQLLVEVIWSITVPAIARAAKAAGDKRGSARIADVMANFCAEVIQAKGFMGFVQREPERALRLLTTRATDYQARLVGLLETLIEEEATRAALTTVLPVHDLAYLSVRISEAFVYTDAIAGEMPDPEKVRSAVRALMRD